MQYIYVCVILYCLLVSSSYAPVNHMGKKNTSVCACTYTHLHMGVHKHTHKNTRTHTHTHTHTQNGHTVPDCDLAPPLPLFIPASLRHAQCSTL